MTSRNILIFGATSAIAQACARLWVERGDRVLLVGRDATRLDEVAADLRVRSTAADAVQTFRMDAVENERSAELFSFARQALGSIDVLLLAHGSLPDQPACEASVEETRRALEINGTSTVLLMTAIGQFLEQQGRGTLAVIGSPAGDRGRASNYTYGAAKAMVHGFAAGMRHRFARGDIRVVTIKPGFVDTPMTAGFEKGGPLWSTPARVAPDIVAAIDAGKSTIYTPWFWRWIMLVIRLLPEPIFLKTRL